MSHARTWVVGDIHGCAHELSVLLDEIAPQSTDTVVFLGDYIDRGPASRDVVDRLLQLRREHPATVFLRGNHEDMFLAYLGFEGRYAESFLLNGGLPTLQSYGIFGRDGAEAAARVPDDHLEFLTTLRTWHSVDPFLCVHAGVRPTVPLERQDEEDLFWIRREFVETPHPFPVTIVFGHTAAREVFVDLPFKIGLDTGVVYGNKLSALALETGELLQVSAGENRGHRSTIDLTSVRR